MGWLKFLFGDSPLTKGERALKDVADMITYNRNQRDLLRENGWERILSPPLVNNEWVWKHPLWGFKTQGEAVRIIEAEVAANG